MLTFYRQAFPLLWGFWGAYWLIAASGTKGNARVEDRRERAKHVVPLIIAAFLLWVEREPGSLWAVRLPLDRLTTFWLGFLLALAGMLFTFWARHHLGRNWSGVVTIKQDHELVTSGPYAFVRHPIYSGLLLAILGSALARADILAGIAFLIALAALIRKAAKEDQWLWEAFGASYQAYRARVAALIPLVY